MYSYACRYTINVMENDVHIVRHERNVMKDKYTYKMLFEILLVSQMQRNKPSVLQD